MIFDVLLSRNLCREQLSLCPGVSRFFRGVVFYTLCLHRTRSLVVFSFLGCDFRSLVMWWQRLRAAGGTRLFYSWYHLVFVSFSCLLSGFRQEDISLFCFQLFLSWTAFFLPSIVSLLYMLWGGNVYMQFPFLGLILWWTYNVPCIYATESLLASLLGSRGDDIGLVLQHAFLPTSPWCNLHSFDTNK